MFDCIQQKGRSPLLCALWKKDPFQAKWVILAKAYSMLRDEHGKGMCPFDKFLSIAAPAIGIISPDAYMDMLGWVTSSNNGVPVVRQPVEPDVNNFALNIRTTTMSDIDIVNVCRSCGYPETSTHTVSNIPYLATSNMTTFSATAASTTSRPSPQNPSIDQNLSHSSQQTSAGIRIVSANDLNSFINDHNAPSIFQQAMTPNQQVQAISEQAAANEQETTTPSNQSVTSNQESPASFDLFANTNASDDFLREWLHDPDTSDMVGPEIASNVPIQDQLSSQWDTAFTDGPFGGEDINEVEQYEIIRGLPITNLYNQYFKATSGDDAFDFTHGIL
jgi:hypothetical protein